MEKLYVTYTKKNQVTGEVYSGMASGEYTGSEKDERKIISSRDSNHHKNQEDFDRALIDQKSQDKDAIRGREQMLIEHFGGAKSEGGTSGNAINGISPTNKKKGQYMDAALKLFGFLSLVLAIFYMVT